MPVDQDKRAELAEAELALEGAKRFRFKKAVDVGAASALAPIVAITSCFISDSWLIQAWTFLFAGASIAVFVRFLRKQNEIVREKRRKVEELSGR
ncbi:hypothetical protein F4X86_01395 [Candidatus Saccharibacteria bacterium]|nr:hypothetical protein [Candidatus Saccharibacteria bacterium]